VNRLYHKDSDVPRKHDAGGQSQRRFERGRNEALNHWLKEVAEYTSDFSKGRLIYLGCNSMYKTRIMKYTDKGCDIK